MNKVSFWRSIHLKFVIIYVLLILVAMQIIGVYFVRQLEFTLKDNFKSTIEDKVNLLAFYVEEQMIKDRQLDDNAVSLEEDIYRILRDYHSEDILEVRVIEGSTFQIIGTSDSLNQGMVGQRTTLSEIRLAISSGQTFSEEMVDDTTKNRIWVLITPVKTNGEVIGAIYLVGNMENVYAQMRQINQIFISGTAIALVITALLGVLLAQTITRPISDMRRQAIAMAKGNFSRKVKVYGKDEIGQLAQSFNNLSKKLQDAQSSTDGERRKLSSVLANMTDGVIATDRKGRVILINNSASDMLKISSDDALLSPLVEILDLDEEYTFEQLLQQKESITIEISNEKEFIVLRAHFSVIQKEAGFVNGLIVVLHDVTEMEKVENERREFVANVSHELRTPLTTMRSYLEALAEGAWKDENIAPTFLEVTQTETERMIRLVNDLLQLSKMDSKDYKLTKEWVNLSQFYNRIIDRFEMSKNQNVQFVRKIVDNDIFVEIDSDKLTQILDNIISNALKYSPEGGTITFKITELGEKVLISISDQGMGIPKKNLHRIFDRFYRVDKARTRELGGTGLGLAIAKEMVIAHGGEIWAESKEGKGTTIFFTLPYIRSVEDEWE